MHQLAQRPNESVPPRRRARTAVMGLALLALSIAPLLALAADAATEAGYRRQFQALATDDLDGHVKLALWCRNEQAYDLLLKQCNHILKLQPDHAQARLLLKLAKSKLTPSGATADPADPTGGGTPVAPTAGKSNLLTEDQVQILKRKELKLDQPERITVELRNNVDERFWNFIAPLKNLSRDARTQFNRMRPPQKAIWMLQQITILEQTAVDGGAFDDVYSADIVIKNDPFIFKTYKTKAWKLIANGCASAQCHGGDNAVGFRLFNERTMSDEMHYTNYLILHDYARGEDRLINRDHPEQSLLLVYGLPPASQTTIHPVPIDPVYRTPTDRKLQTLYAWIALLPPPTPDYGIEVEGVN